MEDGTTTTSSDPAMETEAMESGPTEEDWGEDISPDKDGMVFKKILREGEGDERPGKKIKCMYITLVAYWMEQFLIQVLPEMSYLILNWDKKL